MARATARKAGVWALALLALTAGLLWFASQRTTEAKARQAIIEYDRALAEATARLDPELMAPVASEREKQRVANYIILLNGRGVTLESTLHDFEVLDVASEDPTVTVTVRERWTYRERDKDTGEYVSDEYEEAPTLRYTLLPEGDGYTVYLAEVIEEGREE